MIEYGLESLRDARIKDVCVVLGGAKPEQIMQYLGDGFRYDLNLSYKWQGEPKGIAHAIQCAKDYIGDQKFIVYLADNLFESGVSKFVKDFQTLDCDAYLPLKEVKHPERYGVVVLNDGAIIDIEEKPKHPKSNLVDVGLYGFKPTIFGVIEKLKPSWRGEYEITDAIKYMITNDGFTVEYTILESRWFDAGTFESILDASLFIRKKMRGR